MIKYIAAAVLVSALPAVAAAEDKPPVICESYAFVDGAAGFFVPAVPGKNVFVCDWEVFPQTEGGRVFLAACNGNGNFLRQITASRTYAFATGTGPVTHDIAANAYYRGINTGVGNALCAQDTGNAAIGVFYDQE